MIRTYSKDSKKYFIENNTVDVIFQDSETNIWIGTERGLNLYDKKTQQVIPISKVKGQTFEELDDVWVSAIYEDKAHNLWIGARGSGLFVLTKDSIRSYSNCDSVNCVSSNEIYCIYQDANEFMWIGTNSGLNRLNPISGEVEIYKKEMNSNRSLSHNSVLSICSTSDSILWIGTEAGLNKLNIFTDKITIYTRRSGHLINDYIYSIIDDGNNNLWMSTNRGLMKFDIKREKVVNYSLSDGVQGQEFNLGAYHKSYKGELFFGGLNGFNSFFPEDVKVNKILPKIIVTSVDYTTKAGKDVNIQTELLDELTIPYGAYHIIFNFAKLEYTNPDQNKYKYRLIGISDNWIFLNDKNYVEFSTISSGEFVFEIIGANSDDIWSKTPCTLNIIVETPLWQTRSAFVLYIMLIVTVLLIIFMRIVKNLRNANLLLVEKDKASKEIERQRSELANKNTNITDSLVYARHIIDAMMPSKKFFKSLLQSSFVLAMPKDIVSGDFFWIAEHDGKLFLAVVDCTGHGVPGALMSITGLDLLRNITDTGITEPHEILNELNRGVARAFDTDRTEEVMRDGMDISLCIINIDEKKLDFSGAFNPLLLIRDGNLIEVKADRFSIGHASIREQQKFTKHTVPLEKDDIIYLTTDGYTDQFGGPDGKKFKKRRFRYLLLSLHKEAMEHQKQLLENTILNWRNELEQVDDILLVGIRPLHRH